MWLEVLYWIDPVWSSVEYVCCACGPSERLDAPSICFVCVLVSRKRELDHRCLLFYVVSLCDFAYYGFG